MRKKTGGEIPVGLIFGGLIFVFFNFNIYIGSHTIGLIPDFIGFILIARGLKELGGESIRFQKLYPVAVTAFVYSLLNYTFDLFRISELILMFRMMLAVISAVLLFYILYAIIRGIKDMEIRHGGNFNSGKLKITWAVMLVLQTVSIISIMVPVLFMVYMSLFPICVYIFLIFFHRGRKRYESRRMANLMNAFTENVNF